MDTACWVILAAASLVYSCQQLSQTAEAQETVAPSPEEMDVESLKYLMEHGPREVRSSIGRLAIRSFSLAPDCCAVLSRELHSPEVERRSRAAMVIGTMAKNHSDELPLVNQEEFAKYQLLLISALSNSIYSETSAEPSEFVFRNYAMEALLNTFTWQPSNDRIQIALRKFSLAYVSRCDTENLNDMFTLTLKNEPSWLKMKKLGYLWMPEEMYSYSE